MATTYKITALTDGQLQVWEKPDDGAAHRRVIVPGQDVSSEAQPIRDAAEEHHTPEKVTAFETQRAADIAAMKAKFG